MQRDVDLQHNNLYDTATRDEGSTLNSHSLLDRFLAWLRGAAAATTQIAGWYGPWGKVYVVYRCLRTDLGFVLALPFILKSHGCPLPLLWFVVLKFEVGVWGISYLDDIKKRARSSLSLLSSFRPHFSFLFEHRQWPSRQPSACYPPPVEQHLLLATAPYAGAYWALDGFQVTMCRLYELPMEPR